MTVDVAALAFAAGVLVGALWSLVTVPALLRSLDRRAVLRSQLGALDRELERRRQEGHQ